MWCDTISNNVTWPWLFLNAEQSDAKRLLHVISGMTQNRKQGQMQTAFTATNHEVRSSHTEGFPATSVMRSLNWKESTLTSGRKRVHVRWIKLCFPKTDKQKTGQALLLAASSSSSLPLLRSWSNAPAPAPVLTERLTQGLQADAAPRGRG